MQTETQSVGKTADIPVASLILINEGGECQGGRVFYNETQKPHRGGQNKSSSIKYTQRVGKKRTQLTEGVSEGSTSTDEE